MTNESISDALKPLAARLPQVVREHEILRVSANLQGADKLKTAETARREVLAWAQRRCGGRLPSEAWNFKPFEYLSGGRNSAVVRIQQNQSDIWAIRADDPDRSIPGRIWTTEVVVGLLSNAICNFSARLLVSTHENELKIEPHTPGFVQQVAEKCLLSCGPYEINAEPWFIDSEAEADRLVEFLINRQRKLPVVVVAIDELSQRSLIPDSEIQSLSRAVLGTAVIAVIPASLTWALTNKFGKQRSVFNGAIRAYLPGFTEDASPYAHRLFLADQLRERRGQIDCVNWIRWVAATESVRRSRLGTDVLSFSSIRNASLQIQRQQLDNEGASEARKLETLQAQVLTLESELKSKSDAERFILDENEAAEERARIAEAQLNTATYRIQQLLDQLKQRGQEPDSNIALPNAWTDFGDWCDQNLLGRVILAAPARSGLKRALFDDVPLAARALLWLANDFRQRKLNGGDGSVREFVIEPGLRNSLCGSDEFRFLWQGQPHAVDWHIKSGGNTRDPHRCLRIYYFWDSNTQQTVIVDMPAHRHSDAS